MEAEHILVVFSSYQVLDIWTDVPTELGEKYFGFLVSECSHFLNIIKLLNIRRNLNLMSTFAKYMDRYKNRLKTEAQEAPAS